VAERRKALIVAVDDYAHEGLRGLAAPISDATALAETLSDPTLGDFDVEVLANELAHRIREEVERFFAGARPDDLMLLHFSCHGLKDAAGELFLAATNTMPPLLGSTAIEAAFVSRLMRRSRARRAVLTLDCCYGGAFERGLVPRSPGVVDVGTQFDQRDLGGGRGRVVITAANAVEYAFEEEELVDASSARPSLFTGAFVEGLSTGAADRDHDGYVGLDELYEFIHDRVREQTPHQTPSKWEFGVAGGLVIARNPRREIVPAALPDELAELKTHPVAASRLGLAHELGQLATAEDLPLAAAARAALTGLLDDDSRRVSAAAREMLDRSKLRLSHDRIDFGTLEVGEPSPVREVTISGSPLAQAASVTVGSTVVRARRIDDRVALEADSSQPVRLDTTVTVSGPAGEATIDVSGAVVAAGAAAPATAPSHEPQSPDARDDREDWSADRTSRQRPGGVDLPPDAPAAEARWRPRGHTVSGRETPTDDGRERPPHTGPAATLGDGLSRTARALVSVGGAAVVLLLLVAPIVVEFGWEIPLVLVDDERTWIAVPGLLPLIGVVAAAAHLHRRESGPMWGDAMAAGASLCLLSLLTLWLALAIALGALPEAGATHWLTALAAVTFISGGIAAGLTRLHNGMLSLRGPEDRHPSDALPATLLAVALIAYWVASAPFEPSWAPFVPSTTVFFGGSSTDRVVGSLHGAVAVGVAMGLGMLRPRRFAGGVLVTWLATWLTAMLWQALTSAKLLDGHSGAVAFQTLAFAAAIAVGVVWMRSTEGAPDRA
jgi:hypothetical protein